MSAPKSQCAPESDDFSDMGSEDSYGGQDVMCSTCEGPRKLFTDGQNVADKIVAVIVTIFEGSSYDPMFREVTPTTVPGERTSTYSLSCTDVGKLHTVLAPTAPMVEDEHHMWRCLVEDVWHVPSDSVVFNWARCTGCGDHAFHRANAEPRHQGATPMASVTMQFMGFALRSGFTVMCSDFSLKSLIHEWSDEQLGPNPFWQVGTCRGQICLEFSPSELQSEEVPQQLQLVGELCAEKGKAVVNVLGDTILYTVNPTRQATNLYELKVLTVATDYESEDSHLLDSGIQEEAKCTMGEGDAQKKGLAGHVTITYAEGGQLVTSMGHWIELTRLDSSFETVMRAARHNFGEEEVSKFNRELATKCSAAERSEYLQQTCHQLVTKSAPTRMKQRTKY